MTKSFNPMTRILNLLIVATLLLSCAEERKFPEVQKVSELKSTEFIPTLESSISSDKNAVYAATLLYAWDEIRKEIGTPLVIENSYSDLVLLDKSKSYLDVLESNEYTTEIDVEDFKVTAKAEFKKALPFEIPLISFKDKLVFNNTKVASFGIDDSRHITIHIIEIVYYKNDNNFIIKLLPKEKEHEIILFKTEEKYSSIAEMNNAIKKYSKVGTAEIKNYKLQWKYLLREEDEVIIPKFNFNLETNHKTLENSKFTAGKEEYFIEKAKQRTAFILDEMGAEVESDALIETATTEESIQEEKPKPKKMKFDKPFLILLQRKAAENPYFALWNANSELMTKE